MAKKKTFQEYTQEALYEIEKTEAALKQAKLEKEQAEHRIQRSLNYLDTQKKKKRKARTHLLIQKGAAIEAICKDTKYLTEAEFYQLMDELLHDPACKFCDVVHEMVRGRAETAEVKERELAEEEALLKAMKRGELPQGDEYEGMLSLSSESIIQRKRTVCHCQCCLSSRCKTGMYLLWRSK